MRRTSCHAGGGGVCRAIRRQRSEGAILSSHALMAEAVFSLDEAALEASPKRTSPPSSAATPPPESDPQHVPNEDIAVARRVVPLLEFSEGALSCSSL